MERLGISVVEPVVRRGDGVDRRGEQRVRRGIVDALAVDEATAAVDERRAVLVPSHHRHRGFPPVRSGWSLQVLPRVGVGVAAGAMRGRAGGAMRRRVREVPIVERSDPELAAAERRRIR